MTWNVIWQVDPDDLTQCIERDWFNEITSVAPIGSTQADYDGKPLLSAILPYSIICVSCPNQTSVSDLVEYLKRIPKPRVLYHMSDEYLQVGYDLYQHCELVIRNGSANFTMDNDPKILQIPLGYVSGLGNASGVFPRSSERKCSFAFLGTIKNDRPLMLKAFDSLKGPKIVRRTKSFVDATKHFGRLTTIAYKNAIFAPNPSGNWNPECFRLYDVLEWGCIPLIKRYSDSRYREDYHDRLFGNHPVPTFGDWSGAVDFSRDLLSNKVELDNLQTKVSLWWRNYKTDLQSLVADKLARLTI